ncbi:MAG: HAD family phosphatase [Clostridiaceae bacterium]
MSDPIIHGIGCLDDNNSFIDLNVGGEGQWRAGQEGVKRILTTIDKKVEYIAFRDKTLAYVKSSMGYPAIYPLRDVSFSGPAEAVLMDLDGTSVHSESFWMWIIERTVASLLSDPEFSLKQEDEIYVSGHSVSEHLQYCIDRYCPGATVEEARKRYFEITGYELSEIQVGRGRADAFTPSPGLKEFLLTLKENGIKIGLVTSGLYEKAWPEILSAFKTLGMGDPLDFYDCIITAGYALRKGQTGNIGELALKPHPWLYAEAARVGLGIEPSSRHKVIGIEDSSAGIISIRLAGFAAIGIDGGNIDKSGVGPLLHTKCKNLLDALPLILDKHD